MSRTISVDQLTKDDLTGSEIFIAAVTSEGDQTVWMQPVTGDPLDEVESVPLARTLRVETPDGTIEPVRKMLIELGVDPHSLESA